MGLWFLASVLIVVQAVLLWGMGWLAGSLAVFSAGMTGLLVLDLLLHRDWLCPRVLFAGFLWVYSVPVALMALLDPTGEGGAKTLTISVLAESSFVLGLVYLAVYLADRAPLEAGVRDWLHRRSLSDGMLRSIMKIGLCVAGPLWVVAAAFLWRAGLVAYSSKTELKRAIEGSPWINSLDTVFAATLVLLLLFGLLVAPLFLRANRQRLRPAVLLLMTYFLPLAYLPLVLVDRRRWGAVAVLGVLLAWHLSVRRVPRRVLLPLGVALALGVLTLNLFRGDSEVGSLLAVVAPYRHGEMRIVHDSLRAVDEHIAVESPMWGATYLNSYRILLPRFLVNRPTVEPDTDLEKLIAVDPSLWYSARKDMQRALAGHHFGFSSLAEAHLNFPYLGPTVLVFFVVYLLRHLYAGGQQHAFLAGLYIVFASSLFWFIRGTLPNFSKEIIVFFLIPVLLVVIGVRCLPPSVRGAPRIDSWAPAGAPSQGQRS